jgi:hypothetical protein
MIVVDCWKVYSKLKFDVNEEGKRIKKETQKQFFGRIAAELIANKQTELEQRQCPLPDGNNLAAIEQSTGRPTSGIGPRLTPTKKKRKTKDPTTVGKVIASSARAKQRKFVRFVTMTLRSILRFSCVLQRRRTIRLCVFTPILL